MSDDARAAEGYGSAWPPPPGTVSNVFPRVPPGTSSATVWVWLIVVLPVLSAAVGFGYLEQMQRTITEMLELFSESFAGYGSQATSRALMELELSLLLSPLLLAAVVVGWGSFALSLWFMALDVRELRLRGFVSPFHWPWGAISPLVYVIGRHVVVRRRGGEGAAPLIAMIVVTALSFTLTMVWAVALNMQFLAVLLPALRDR